MKGLGGRVNQRTQAVRHGLIEELGIVSVPMRSGEQATSPWAEQRRLGDTARTLTAGC